MSNTKTLRKHFPVLLSDEERAALQAIADNAEVNASDWIRATIMRAYKRAFGDAPIKAGPRVKTGPQNVRFERAMKARDNRAERAMQKR